MPRLALFALAFLLACDDAADPVTVRSAPIDVYPDDPFAFGCDLPPVDLAELTPQSCAIMLAACVDAAIGPCGGMDAKDCAGAVDECVESTQAACWSRLP